ncbi:MAG: ABC transporter permease subunit [Anaerolineae bacterium]|nr:ABC transporter permease subunit [Anaerolineae bacterium]
MTTEQTSATITPARSAFSFENVRRTKTWQRGLRHLFSYLFLIAGSSFMLVPLLWMFSASLKPQWQIFTTPIMWIPQHWEEVRAGATNRMIPLWVTEVDGETQKVIIIGVRRYTTALDAANLRNLQSAPSDEVGDAAAMPVGDLLFNVRPWTTGGVTRDVVALARDGDDLIVAALEDVQAAAMRLPLDELNSGDRISPVVEDVEFRGREVEIDGATLQLIPIGPETELNVVSAPDVAAGALLVPTERLSSAGFAEVGETEIALSRIEGDATDYVVLISEQWQPVIDEEEVDAKAFVAARGQLGERREEAVNGVTMQTARYTPDEGASLDVVVLVSGTDRSLVMPVDQVESLRLAQAGGLTSARGDSYERIPYRVLDGFSEGEETSSVALVGDPRDMSLIVARDAVDSAFDVSPTDLERALHPQLSFDGFREVLQTKIAETRFTKFFVNSFILVFLNIVGHVLSCVIVAYAFARLRAPGKNFLFIILLGTMMLPFPVTLVPVYEIFRDLGMINTWWPLFMRAFFGNAFLIFMLRQFFASIPRELEEAARIDGAGVAQIIWRIIVPLSKPAIATVVIFTFWWTWNSFLEPFIFLSSPELFPVSVGLNFFKDQYGAVYYDRLISASVMSMIPMLVIFFFAQRYFIEGIQLTGIKG